MKFCEKIVRLRKIKGITQDEFANAVGVSRQAVYKWECGQSYPEVAKLLEIKLLFGISLDDLLDDNYEVILPDGKKRKRAAKKPAPVVENNEDAVSEAEKIVAPETEKTNENTEIEAPVSAKVESAEDYTEEKPEAIGEEKPTAEAAPAASEVLDKKADEPENKDAGISSSEENKEEKKEEEPKKKAGFFARLFGRK